MLPFMDVHGRQTSKGSVTEVALKWLLSRVPLEVAGQGGLLAEALLAVVAAEGPLTCVGAQMGCQDSFFEEPHWAHLTLEGPFFHVPTLVFSQAIPLGKPHGTAVTPVWLVVCLSAMKLTLRETAMGERRGRHVYLYPGPPKHGSSRRTNSCLVPEVLVCRSCGKMAQVVGFVVALHYFCSVYGK